MPVVSVPKTPVRIGRLCIRGLHWFHTGLPEPMTSSLRFEQIQIQNFLHLLCMQHVDTLHTDLPPNQTQQSTVTMQHVTVTVQEKQLQRLHISASQHAGFLSTRPKDMENSHMEQRV